MRDDQIQRLRDLSEKLADTFLLEADPGEWPGDGKSASDLTAQERGDRYWSKKNAMATGGVLRYTLDLAAKAQQPQAMPGTAEAAAQDADIDRQIREAEKRAAAAVSRVIGKAKGEFDRRVHGKTQ